MPARRSAPVLAGAAALLLAVGLGPAFSQDAAPGLEVRAVRSGLETKPLKTVTVVFRVVNRTGNPRDFVPRLELPGGWSQIITEEGFRLKAGEETVRLVSVLVPVRAAAGSYRVGYCLSSPDDLSLSAWAEAEIRVLLEVGLAVEASQAHNLVIAGDRPRSEFVVTNKSNAPLSVDLEVLSNGPGASLEARKLRLETGESRAVCVSIATDSGLPQKLSQNVQLTASAKVPDKGPVSASAMTEIEIIPRISGKGDYFDRLPAEAGLSAIGANGARGYGQFRLSGSGALGGEGRRLDFYFRGPGRRTGRDLAYVFSLRPAEYRLRYESPTLDVRAGDGGFALTRLTETGNYGRGLDVAAAFGRWRVRGFFESLLLQTGGGREKALQLSWRSDDRTSFHLSYLTRKAPDRAAASQIFSLRTQLVRSVFQLNGEYAWDWSEARGIRRANSALWIEGGHNYRRWQSQVAVVRAGARFHGYYENLDYNMVETSYAGTKKWNARASYRDQRTHVSVAPYVQPYFDRTVQAGIRYQAFPRLNVSLDERVHDRRDLSGQGLFDYRDSTLRLGAFYFAGAFGLQSSVDVGRTRNRLVGRSERLREYSVSANYLGIERLSLAAYLHYRDQEEAFTGDKIRRLDVNINAGLRLGRLNLSAFFRTAVVRDLYRNPLSRGDFEDPDFLLNNYDAFGASLTWRLGSGHTVSFKAQRMANPYWDGALPKAFVGMLEYSVPIGLPVGRNRSVGMLRGRIYDSGQGMRGVPGVIVKMNDLATVTGPKGEYAFNGLAPGPYLLSLDDLRTGAGKVPVERMPVTVIVEGGRKVNRPIGLTDGASLAGRIAIYDRRAGASGPEPQLAERAPLCGATVTLRGEGEVLEQVTDGEGRFLFECLRPGAYILQVFDDDLPELHVFERDTFEFKLGPGTREDVAIRVLPVVRPIQIIDQGEVKIVRKKDGIS